MLMRKLCCHRLAHDQRTCSTQFRDGGGVSLWSVICECRRAIGRRHVACIEDVLYANGDSRQRQMGRIFGQRYKLVTNLLGIVPRPGSNKRLARCDPGKLLF
jgi:hypothetical protein